MNFKTELTVFPSAVHSCIYSAARGITPLEHSLTGVSNPDMRSSCEAYHGFIMDMLSDMYDNPLAYGLPVSLLEDFCGGSKVNGMKQKFPSKTKGILAQTRNAVSGYIMLLYKLARSGICNGDKLTVPADVLAQIGKATSSSVSPIPLDVRLKALERAGLTAKGGVFTGTRYQGMFPAMCELAGKADKTSGFDYFAFTTLEFRNIEKTYKPVYEDYYNPLISKQREYAYLLHDYAVENKMKPTVNTFWKVDYKYKGAQVMCVGSEGDHERLLDIRIVGTYNWEDSALINNRLAKEPPEFQKNVLRHIWRCDACSTSHLGMFVTVLGKRARVCGGGIIGFRWRNPGDEDLAVIQKLLKFRCEIIDELKIKK